MVQARDYPVPVFNLPALADEEGGQDEECAQSCRCRCTGG